MPELPWAKRERYKKDYGMTDKEVAVFVESPELSIYYESIVKHLRNDSRMAKLAVNYLLTDYLGILKARKHELTLNRQSLLLYSQN